MIELKNIAKQWKSISLKELSSSYNDLKIVRQEDLGQLSKIKIGSETILVMAVRKVKTPSKLDLILERLNRIENRLDGIETRLDKHDQLFKDLIKANNLIDPTI